MRVAILTTFGDLKRSYSLCSVALEQCGIFITERVDFAIFVNEVGPRLNEASVDAQEWLKDHVRKEVPTGHLKEDVVDEDLRKRTAEWLRTVLPEFDVVITHDWMFTSWFLTYNAAVRDVCEEFPQVAWLHWVHSAPGDRPSRIQGAVALRYQPMPNAIYVYLNEADRLRYAEYLGTDLEHVAVCYNPLDAAGYFGCGPQLARFVRKHRLWDHDLMQVYPLSMPRAEAKGLTHLIGIFGEWKRLGFRVKLVVVNAHTTAESEKRAVNSYGQMAKLDWGLGSTDLVWTSTEEGWEYEVPHEDVRTLFRMSNVFVFPTISEACSRILQEASLAGCLVVGNESFPPMKEFLDRTVRSYTFGSTRDQVNFPLGVDHWRRQVAQSLLPLLDHPAMRQKTHMMRLASWQTIWREQLLPILERAQEMARERVS